MADSPTPGMAPSVKAQDRLDSWKEIAAYLNRDVTTVQRWEKREGMPVHRHLHDKMGSVYASRAELDSWTRARSGASAEDDIAAPLSQPLPVQGTPRRWALLLSLLATFAMVVGVAIWLSRTEYFWRNPIADARFQRVTDFDGLTQSAAISPDGHLVAFLSDRDGQVDVWVTQAGSGEFHNLTRGSAPGLVNPSVRNLRFTPDGSLVTFWTKQGPNNGDISVWAVPTLGGEPRPYLGGVAELDWSHDGSRLAYHTPGPGDPLFVSKGMPMSLANPVFTAPPGIHSHFPVWSPDDAYIYLVQGSIPDKLDIWRIKPEGGTPERITSHNETVGYPVLLDRRTLLYIANDSDGSGPWLYGMDVERRVPHRLSPGLERYTSLAASGDGRRLVLTLATPKRTLWRSRIAPLGAVATEPVQVSLSTSTGFSPRLGPDYLLHISSTGANESIWKISAGTAKELWTSDGAQVFGGPAISRDGKQVIFSVRQNGKTFLYVMQADGTQARIVTNSLELQGSPVWTPDDQAIITSAIDHGIPHLYRISRDGHTPAIFLSEYSVDPAWTSDGSLVVYSGPDIGTTFSVKAVTSGGAPRPLPSLTLTRGARHIAFLPGGQTLVVLRGDLQHKNVWLIDLATGSEKQLTNLPPDFDIRDFDISPDGRELILERAQERSDVVMLDLVHR